MSEQWKPVVGYEGLYEVSSYGRVNSIRREGTKGGVLKPYFPKCSGYLNVTMSKNGVCIQKRLHLLTLEAFIGKRPDGMEANHIDSDPTNNKINNLKWDTHSNNIKESIRIGNKIPIRNELGQFIGSIGKGEINAE